MAKGYDIGEGVVGDAARGIRRGGGRDRRGVGRILTRLSFLARDLAGRTDQLLVDLIVRQARCAAHGIDLAGQVAAGALGAAEARRQIGQVEHDGDAYRAALIVTLRRSVTSPVDREDLFRLSRRVDDVLDAVRDFVREFDLFNAGPDPAYEPVLAALAMGLTRLEAAVRLLAATPRQAAESAAEAKKPGVRPAYQRAVARLVASGSDTRDLSAVLLLGRLDLAGERLAAAADALADGVMKRFQ